MGRGIERIPHRLTIKVEELPTPTETPPHLIQPLKLYLKPKIQIKREYIIKIERTLPPYTKLTNTYTFIP
jgi:hypothetical protein